MLTGVLVEMSREGVTLVATDSYRLAVRDLVATAAGEAKAIVPERAMSEAGRAAQALEKGEIELFVDDSQISFQAGSLMLTSRLIEGEFPNYRQLLPGAVREPAHGLPAAADRRGSPGRPAGAGHVAGALEFNALGVKLSSSSPDLGQAVEAVEARYEGEDMTAAFNPTYLADGLAAATGEPCGSRCATG